MEIFQLFRAVLPIGVDTGGGAFWTGTSHGIRAKPLNIFGAKEEGR